ncbi:DUF1120 domain-containing protein [Erwiniaceae bacterium BAC15a-03b]|uniref:DUF1120 domain-containing protein n=1 Tax=Winslowiella arboricola TaxID=2978220 RepID=A0A9J6PQK9_9GAMM|nr:DUF1120 domain-containing protein [Winslowiella arboricola]MCU5772971.1 DUF1120 domain-containing protein [Winslowiella arboricola]MCU5780601.1 DUF1120 domain-containing protein [Winslowiella arboricola]
MTKDCNGALKKSILAIVVAMIPGFVAAQQTATLQVQGRIIPSACGITLSDAGLVTFDDIIPDPTEDRQLGNKNLTMTISCGAPTHIAWAAQDENFSSLYVGRVEDATENGAPVVDKRGMFGLGWADSAQTSKLGAFTIASIPSGIQSDATGDTAVGHLRQEGDWVFSNGLMFNGRDEVRWQTIIDQTTRQPAAFRMATFPLRISALLQKLDGSTVADDIQLAGRATLSLVYL